MFSRVDLVSETTGRVLLRAAYDTAPEGLNPRECQAAIKVLIEAKQKLEKTLGFGTVRLSLDDYSSSVFWFLVLHRPVEFDPDNPLLGKKAWSAYELCQNPKLAARLKQLNLGLVYDKQRNWLILIWPEAVHGILEDFEKSISWEEIIKREKERLGEVSIAWWKSCAASHSFVVPPWRLLRLSYLQQVLWHRPGLTYDDITVFDIAGADIPSIDQHGLAVLPVAKRARFVHFYTEDKREFQNVKKLLALRIQRDPKIASRQEFTRQWRVAQEEKRRAYWLASRCINQVFVLHGGSKFRTGKFRKYLDPAEADRMYEIVVDQLANGAVAIKPDRVNALLEELKTYLGDLFVPKNFERWLALKNRAKGILAVPRGEDNVS